MTIDDVLNLGLSVEKEKDGYRIVYRKGGAMVRSVFACFDENQSLQLTKAIGDLIRGLASEIKC